MDLYHFFIWDFYFILWKHCSSLTAIWKSLIALSFDGALRKCIFWYMSNVTIIGLERQILPRNLRHRLVLSWVLYWEVCQMFPFPTQHGDEIANEFLTLNSSLASNRDSAVIRLNGDQGIMITDYQNRHRTDQECLRQANNKHKNMFVFNALTRDINSWRTGFVWEGIWRICIFYRFRTWKLHTFF